MNELQETLFLTTRRPIHHRHMRILRTSQLKKQREERGILVDRDTTPSNPFLTI